MNVQPYDLGRTCRSLAEFSKDCLGVGKDDCLPTKLDGEFLAANMAPTTASTKRGLKRERRKARLLTKGPDWFGMPAVGEVSEEVKTELEILRYGRELNPRKFYKKNDGDEIPKYFQIGTIQGKPKNLETTRQARKPMRSFLDELKSDEKQMKYIRKRYAEHKEREKLKKEAEVRASRWKVKKFRNKKKK